VTALLGRLQGDLNAARKAQDKPLTLLLGTVLADVKNREIELRRSPTDDEVLDVLRKGLKRRRESLDVYGAAGREDLAAKERVEVEVLERYLPPQVSADELRAAVQAAISGGATSIGAIMGKVLPQYKGRAEGSAISAIAREELSRQG
jgi:uncharacterized protein YqeY